MLVSIGIPTYNRPETLPKAINSLLEQTYSNLEIIISNNHSTNPDVEKVIKDFQAKDSRIIYYYQPQPLKVIDNFSFVLNEAKGDYFFWLSDDDWVEPNYVEECLKILENDSSYISVSGKCYYHDSNGSVLDAHSAIDLSYNSPQKRMTLYYKTVSFNAYFGSIIRTKYAKEIGLTEQLAFDWIFVAALAFSGKIKTIQTTSNHLTTGGISSDSLALGKKMGEHSFIAKYFVGLKCSINVARDIYKCKVYNQLTTLTRLKLSLQLFAASYYNVWQWDYVINKRRLKKWWKNRSKQ